MILFLYSLESWDFRHTLRPGGKEIIIGLLMVVNSQSMKSFNGFKIGQMAKLNVQEKYCTTLGKDETIYHLRKFAFLPIHDDNFHIQVFRREWGHFPLAWNPPFGHAILLHSGGPQSFWTFPWPYQTELTNFLLTQIKLPIPVSYNLYSNEVRRVGGCMLEIHSLWSQRQKSKQTL